MSKHKRNSIHYANRFLSYFLKEKYLEEFLGDLEEMHEEREKSKGGFIAKFLYWIDVIHLTIGFSSFQVFTPSQNPSIMLKHYFTISTRNILKNRSSSLINIIGLSLGIASALVIAFAINYELEYDDFHSHSDQIYRVVRVSQVEGETEYRTGTTWPLPPAMNNDIAALHHMTSMIYWGSAQIDVIDEDGSSYDKFQEDEGCAFVSESFFEIFDFKYAGVQWLYGNPESALVNPNSVVLTQSLAQKYFNTTMAIGKSIQIGKNIDFIVTGVISDLPSNTNFPFDILCSYSTLYEIMGKRRMESWNSISDSHQTYIVLPHGMTKSEMEHEITRVHEKYVSEDIAAMRTYPLQQLSQVHKDSRFGNYNNTFTSMKSIWILGTVGVFLLVMISINFINTTIANSINRSKEIGLRKVMGSNRIQVISQFLMETFVLTVIAAILAIIGVELLKTEIQSLFEFQIKGLFISNNSVQFVAIAIIAIITILAGWYPAFMQTRHSPNAVLKTTVSTKIGKSIRISNALILIQFTITIMLVTSTLIVIQQLRFFNSVDLGFDKDAVVNLYLPNNASAALSAFKKKSVENSAITEVSYSSTVPSGLGRIRGYMDIKRKGSSANESIIYEYQSIDPEYLQLYNLELEGGNNIHFSDTSRSVIINHTLMNKLGYSSIEACLGSEVEMGLDKPCIIKGVLKDFHNQSLKEGFGKIAMVHNPDHFRMASIKLNNPNRGLYDESHRH